MIQLKKEKKIIIKLWWWTTLSTEIIFYNFYRPDDYYRGLIATILGQASKTGEKKKAQSLLPGHAARTEE